MNNKYEISFEDKNSKFEILMDFIKDISFEIPSAEAYINLDQEISKYETKINISSKILKNQLHEINCNLILEAPNQLANKIHIELCLAIIFKFLDDRLSDFEKKKIILAEIPNLYSSKLSNIIDALFKFSGFNNFTFKKNFDFLELFESNQKKI